MGHFPLKTSETRMSNESKCFLYLGLMYVSVKMIVVGSPLPFMGSGYEVDHLENIIILIYMYCGALCVLYILYFFQFKKN